MTDSTSPSAKPNPSFTDTRWIDLETRGELEFWLKVLDTSREELLAAIASVGPYAGAVAIYLRSMRATVHTPAGELPQE